MLMRNKGDVMRWTSFGLELDHSSFFGYLAALSCIHCSDCHWHHRHDKRGSQTPRWPPVTGRPFSALSGFFSVAHQRNHRLYHLLISVAMEGAMENIETTPQPVDYTIWQGLRPSFLPQIHPALALSE